MNGGDRRAWWTSASIGLLAVLCLILILLQYRWTGEVARAEQERLKASLQSAVDRFSRDFNSELASAAGDLVPRGESIDETGVDRAYAERYARRRDPLIRRLALAVPAGGDVTLRLLDFASGQFVAAPWPAEWTGMRERVTSRLRRDRPQLDGGDDGVLIEIPRMSRPQRPGDIAEQEWLIIEYDLAYIRTALLPRLIDRHFAGEGKPAYEVEIVSRTDPAASVIYSTAAARLAGPADAAAPLFESQYPDFARRFGRGGPPGRFGGPPPGRGAGPGRGRWEVRVRHQAGSLETIVERARWRNLAVSGSILLLMLATVATLVRFSRRADQLAALQMNFVAGVSHELRTPLTVIRTAAYNLRGKVSENPAQVERYGALIQDESEKLTALVEQVLQFSSAGAGRVIGHREPVAPARVIDDSLLRFSAGAIERDIAPALPLILADPVALQRAIQNLVDNALKYAGDWVRVSATASAGGVEIRVADRGPGIPPAERDRIFDPFFRGDRAIKDQVHGTGLGLNLVKRIIEAHGGSIAVVSEPGQGSEFVVRIPAAPPELQNELAHSLG